MVKSRIALIQSNEVVETMPRRFTTQPDPEVIPQSPPNATYMTPLAHHRLDGTSRTLTQAPIDGTFIITKPMNEAEMIATSRLDSYFQPHFARLYWGEADSENGTVTYCFEKLEPLFDSNGTLSGNLFSSEPH